MKYLFIDDNLGWLDSLKRIFSKNSNVYFVQCKSVESALDAIAEVNPDVIFLDNFLTNPPRRNDGLEIADKIAGKRKIIYSTTSYIDIYPEYHERGIETIGKDTKELLKKLKTIIGKSIKN